jgi:pyrimidine-nucleoside phosphorylase
MRMVDIIHKKRSGRELSDEEIAFFVRGVSSGELPDYQAAALLMAIYFRGMTPRETALLTAWMAASGDRIDLSAIEGFKVDKHSTGGVGDKTTLIAVPLVAACGVRVAKMSGRGLGHTGGTIDKLESISGFDAAMTPARFFEVVRSVGAAVTGQTGNLAPADKKLYALRDMTDTVDSLPLIASSIMSKKLASGADGILLDVKAGSGAFMKTLPDAILLAQAMVSIGERNGRRCAALITGMDSPLGAAVGNAVEVAEAADTLKGGGPNDLTEVSVELAANMLLLAGRGDLAQCRARVRAALDSGEGFLRLKAMVQAQGGEASVLDDTSRLVRANHRDVLTAWEDGFVLSVDALRIGRASMLLGAGRESIGGAVDPTAGILLAARPGCRIKKGDRLATLLTGRPERLGEARRTAREAFAIGRAPPDPAPLILARVDSAGVERYGEEGQNL